MRLHATKSCRCITFAHLHDRRAEGWHRLSCRPQYSSSPLTCTSCQQQRYFARSHLVLTHTTQGYSVAHRERLNVDAVDTHRKLVLHANILLLPSRPHLLLPCLTRDKARLASFILDSTVIPIYATESCLCIKLAHLHDRRAQAWPTLSCRPQYSSTPLTCTSCQRQRCFTPSQLVPTSMTH